MIFFTGNPFLISREHWDLLKLGCDLSGPKLVDEPRCQLMRNGENCLDEDYQKVVEQDEVENEESDNGDILVGNYENYANSENYGNYEVPDSNEYESTENIEESELPPTTSDPKVTNKQKTNTVKIDDQNPVVNAKLISWRKILIVTLIALCIAIFVIVLLLVFTKTRRMLFMTKGGGADEGGPPMNNRLDDTLVSQRRL